MISNVVEGLGIASTYSSNKSIQKFKFEVRFF
jgi:hypothetical protein